MNDEGLAVAAADPFVVSATILHPPRCVSGPKRRAAATGLAEYRLIKLSRLRRMSVGHQVSVTVECRLDRGVAELRRDVLRVRPLVAV